MIILPANGPGTFLKDEDLFRLRASLPCRYVKVCFGAQVLLDLKNVQGTADNSTDIAQSIYFLVAELCANPSFLHYGNDCNQLARLSTAKKVGVQRLVWSRAVYL